MAIVEFEVFRDHLGVGATDPEVDDVSKLYDAIGAEIGRITRRVFEGDEGGDYVEVIRLDGAEEFRLGNVPVEAIASVAEHNFDGTNEDPYDADRWRLEDPATGLVRLIPSPDYVSVTYTTTGAIPAQLPWAYLEWGKARWDDKDRPANLASYQTGEDAESYWATLAGRAPRQVMSALLGVQHSVGGGKV